MPSALRRRKTLFVSGSVNASATFLRQRLQFFSIFAAVFFIYLFAFGHIQSVSDAFTCPIAAIHAVIVFGSLAVLVFLSQVTWQNLQIIDWALIVSHYVFFSAAAYFFEVGLDADPWFVIWYPVLWIPAFWFIHAALVPTRLRHHLIIILLGALSLLWIKKPEAQFQWHLAAIGEILSTLPVSFLCVCAVISTGISYQFFRIRQDLRQAERFGNYIVEKELGWGGMGKVYKASHALLCRPTAIKVMRFCKANCERLSDLFEAEVKLSATLTHPNTVTIFDYGMTDRQTFFYAMEYLPGLDLQRFIERFGPMEYPRVAYIITQVCLSLGEAHRKGIVHRDVKPSNIFLTHLGGMHDYVKVIDFGLAVSVDQTGEIISKGDNEDLIATPKYIAPEVILSGVIDARTDIYNLGAVMFFLLTGRSLFESDSSVKTVTKQVIDKPPAPSSVCELEIPAEIDRIVLRCLAKDPSDRFLDVEALGQALNATVADDAWDETNAEDWWGIHLPDESFSEHVSLG